MKKISLFLAIIVSLFLTSACSRNKTKNKTKAETKMMNEDDLFASDNSKGGDKNLFNEKNDAASIIDNIEEGNTEMESPSMIGELKSYKVQKSDTMMMISFKLYGDYRKWKSIAKENENILKGGALIAGQELKYRPLDKEFTWDPKGNPYNIKKGDTLGGISNSVYGTKNLWKAIWDNNRALILDPNLIFAGFTIYYLEKSEVAK